jgi:hypothetical protein
LKKGILFIISAMLILLSAMPAFTGMEGNPIISTKVRIDKIGELRSDGFKVNSLSLAGSKKLPGYNYDLIIYGGSPQAVSTALKAAMTTHDKARTLMIVPINTLGSILTVGKQNLFDLNYYQSKHLPQGIPPDYKGAQGGTMFRFLKDMGSVFRPDAMASYLLNRVKAYRNITVQFETDITDVYMAPPTDRSGGPERIAAVRTQKLAKDANGRYVFVGDKSPPLEAGVFIDASESGRLARLAHVEYTIGRQDQGIDSLQMGATLMYKVTGVDAYKAVKVDQEMYGYAYSEQGAFQFWAGDEAFKIPEIMAYDRSSPFFRIKGYNAGEDGMTIVDGDSTRAEFWMNQLLVYDVDARKSWRDYAAGNGYYPQSGGLDPEIAREMAVRELEKPGFIEMLRKLPGFENVRFVMKNGHPEVGDILYLREGIHTVKDKPYTYGLTKLDVLTGGERWFNRRIGIGFYNFDSNTYTKSESLSNPLHEPWYVPYDVLTSPKVANLLIPGYAASIDSFAWTAMRVYPNLIMLGDAAGVAAGLALLGDFRIDDPTDEQIAELQYSLRQVNVILGK